MRRFLTALFGASVLSLACAANTFAADMPMKAVKAPLPVAYNWTGFYVGATAGAALSTGDTTLDPVNGPVPNYRAVDIPGISALGSTSESQTHFIFGGKLGYNQQFNAVVAGLEVDFSYFRFDRSTTASGFPFPGFPTFPATITTSVTTDWLATIRPRLGYAFDRTLVYATGGLAIAKVSVSNSDREFAPNGLFFGNEASSASKTKAGWALGGGVEYALTPNWILSAEYLHIDLGNVDASGTVTSSNAATATLNFSTKVKSDLVRAGIAYKF